MLRKRAMCLWAALPFAMACQVASGGVAPVGVNIQPGPAALNNPPPRAPQLENTGIWQADPILVSGSTAYRKGEFLYQDFLYDDRGATTNGNAGSTQFARSGRYTYPTNVAAYFENAADFVEVRLKLTADGDCDQVDVQLDERRKSGGRNDRSRRHRRYRADDSIRSERGGAGGCIRHRERYERRGDRCSDQRGIGELDSHRRSRSVGKSKFECPSRCTIRAEKPRSGWRLQRASGTARHRATPSPGLLRQRRRLEAPAPWSIRRRFSTSPIGSTNPMPAVRRTRAGEMVFRGRRWRPSVTVNGVQTHDLSSFFATVDFTKLAAGVDDDSGVIKQGFTNRIYSATLRGHARCGKSRGAESDEEPGMHADQHGRCQRHHLLHPAVCGPPAAVFAVRSGARCLRKRRDMA